MTSISNGITSDMDLSDDFENYIRLLQGAISQLSTPHG